MRPSSPSFHPSSLSASSVTKQPTGPQMPWPSVCSATLIPAAPGMVQVAMSTTATTGSVQQPVPSKQPPSPKTRSSE